jgi:argininosuccinate lyase
MNPARTAELLGFSRWFENSLDAVADRDFAVEFLSAASLSMVHLSRLSEELVLWSGTEFGYLELHDSWSTGSSLMPQKRNPDAAELTRGRVGRVVGDLVNLLTQLKGLPLTYNRDLQEDKPAVFDACDTLDACLDVLAGMISACSFRVDKMAEAGGDPALLATDLADALVRAGHSFAVAHELAGKAQVGELSAEEQEQVGPFLDEVTVERALADRAHPGAAGPKAVKGQLEKARACLPVTFA